MLAGWRGGRRSSEWASAGVAVLANVVRTGRFPGRSHKGRRRRNCRATAIAAGPAGLPMISGAEEIEATPPLAAPPLAAPLAARTGARTAFSPATFAAPPPAAARTRGRHRAGRGCGGGQKRRVRAVSRRLQSGSARWPHSPGRWCRALPRAAPQLQAPGPAPARPGPVPGCRSAPGVARPGPARSPRRLVRRAIWRPRRFCRSPPWRPAGRLRTRSTPRMASEERSRVGGRMVLSIVGLW